MRYLVTWLISYFGVDGGELLVADNLLVWCGGQPLGGSLQFSADTCLPADRAGRKNWRLPPPHSNISITSNNSNTPAPPPLYNIITFNFITSPPPYTNGLRWLSIISNALRAASTSPSCLDWPLPCAINLSPK